MMRTIIGLDLGTTTVTGVLLEAESGEVLRLIQRRNDAAIETALPTRAEQDVPQLGSLALEILAQLAKEDSAVDGIAVTGQMHGLLCVDGEGQPLTPLFSWQDQRTAEPLPGGETMLDQLNARLDGLDWHENGCRLAHGYGAATLFWLVQQGELPGGTQRVCTIAGWLTGQLTGQLPASDPTFAASWGIYDLVNETWNTVYLRQLGLDDRLLPPIYPEGHRLGGLDSGMARRVGLASGTPVLNAWGDNQASYVGSLLDSFPAASSRKGQLPLREAVLFNLGTGGQICWMVPNFEMPSKTVETRPLPFGRFLRVGASLCGGAAYAWLNQTVRAWLAEFGLDVSEAAVYERLDALIGAAKGEDGKQDLQGLRVRTTFLGVRGDPTVQAGAIEGITPQNLRLGALARATLEGMVDELHDLYLAHGGERVGHTEVVASGGGVRKNPFLPELIRERFGLPVRQPRLLETAAAGAAMLPLLDNS